MIQGHLGMDAVASRAPSALLVFKPVFRVRARCSPQEPDT